MYLLERRLKRLEEIAAALQEEKKLHEPYYLVRPWSVLKDTAHVSYYPEGNYKPPEKWADLQLSKVIEWAAKHCGEVYIAFSMMSCTEWLFLQSQDESDTLYTAKQRERFRERWIAKNPELSLLVTDKEYMRIADIIKRLPQKGRFTNVR